MNFLRSRPHPESLSVGALLTLLVALGQISTSIYTPSLPALVGDLNTSPTMVNLTMAMFLVGFAVFQLVYGPLSDRYGRRPVLLGGLTVFLLASVACAMAQTIEALIVARFMQGVGACTGQVLGRAIVRDVYGRERSAKALAYLGLALAISPAVTPTIGGYLQTWFGWQSTFVFLTGVALIVLVASTLLMDETNHDKDPNAINLGGISRNFRMFLKDPYFLGHGASVTFVFASLMVFVVSAPFIFISGLGFSPEKFGMLIIINVVGFVAGNLFAGRMTSRLGVDRMVMMGNLLALTGAILLTSFALSGIISVAAIFGPMTLVLGGVGIVFPNAMAGAMAPYPRTAGSASALLGCVQMLAAAIASAYTGGMDHSSSVPMAITILALSLTGTVLYAVLAWPRRHRMQGG